MAAVSPAQSQVGRLSFSARYAADAAGDTVSNAVLLGLCEQGPLYQFFATAYSTDAGMMDDWAASGGLISIQTSGAVTPVARFVRDGGGKPTLALSAGSAGAPVSIRVALSYSASR